MSAKVAEEFLHKVRSETGILIERGKKRYGFLHLTFEEYLAAGALVLRKTAKISSKPISMSLAGEK